MTSKIVDDVKTGLKGVRGAGDALRGTLMQATDQAFDNKRNHAETQASQLKHQAVTDKGKSDMQAVDDRLATREQEREARKADANANADAHGLATNGAGAARDMVYGGAELGFTQDSAHLCQTSTGVDLGGTNREEW
ncbi:hypothetical protein F4859DRAFT_510299 [Xylaria cf. heliscus]|nr:hypothetical protein F4859DRAFT_510299 [Xylaria cf. heliscus]